MSKWKLLLSGAAHDIIILLMIQHLHFFPQKIDLFSVHILLCIMKSFIAAKGLDWDCVYFQEFPDKTRPVDFKHPAFRCPDMRPSTSVPSSGPPALHPLQRFEVFELTSHLIVVPLRSSWTGEGSGYKNHRRLGGFPDSRCPAALCLWWKMH